MVDPVTAAALIATGAIGYAITRDGKVVPISPAQLQDSEVPFAKPIDIDTSVARDNEEYNEAGAMLFVKNPTTPTTTVYIRFNNKQSDIYELTALRKVKGPFGKFFVTNEAGSGTLTLIVTRGFAFEFVESEVTVVGTVLNSISDVSVPSPDDEDVLGWDSTASAWVAYGLTELAVFSSHRARHQDGGLDEISLANLSGEPADTVNKTGAQTIAGVKTFSSIPVGPASDPTTANQLARKSYVDSAIDTDVATHADIKAANATLGHVIVETGSAIDVDGNGKLTLGDHIGTHQDGGTDELSVTNLSGLLADDQHVLDSEVTAVAVARSIFNAHSILIAVSDNTPIVLEVAASRIVGRAASGNIVALAKADVLTIINVTEGADVTGSNAPQAHDASHQDGGTDEISIQGLAGTSADLTTHMSDTTTHGATGAVVGTTNTQELDNKTLDSSVLKGTFTASGTVTFPAWTVGGAITGGGQNALGFGQISAGTASFPVLLVERLRTDTGGVRGGLQLKTKTTANMVDGFGVEIIFGIEDDTANETIGSIGVKRAGADDTGRMIFSAFLTGSAVPIIDLSDADGLKLLKHMNANSQAIDALPCAMSDPVRALDTDYQNSTKPRVVIVTVRSQDTEGCEALIGVGTPPATMICQMWTSHTDADDEYRCFTFIVPPSYYYAVDTMAGKTTPTLIEWIEYDLFA